MLEAPHTEIGQYRIDREIGRGGFDIAPDDSWICFGVTQNEADIVMIEFDE